MNTYQYRARDKAGKLVTGQMGAESESAVAAKLEQMNYIPVDIKKTAAEKSAGDIFSKFTQRVKFTDLNMFTLQLYTLQKAGLPILTSLFSLKEQSTSKSLKNVIDHLRKDIEQGSRLSDAMAKHPQVFNGLYISMVRSGEVSGRLTEILERLSVLGEHDEKVKMQIKSALRYPLIVLVALVIVCDVVELRVKVPE